MTESSPMWQHFLLAEKAKFLRESGHLSDCALVVGSVETKNLKKLQCHKWILISASPVFERLFVGDFKESTLNEIKLEIDIEPTDFEKFLDFIYYNDNQLLESFSMDTMKNLIYLGNMYLVMSLTDACVNIIKNKIKSLDDTDIIKVFELAHLIENADLIKLITELIQSIMKNIGKCCSKCGRAKNAVGVCGTPACGDSIVVSSLITCPYIYEMSSCIFYEFVKALIEVSTEVMRFKLIETYVLLNSNIVDECSDLPSIVFIESTKKQLVPSGVQIEAASDPTKNKEMLNVTGDADKKLVVATDNAKVQAISTAVNTVVADTSVSKSWIEENDDLKSQKILIRLLKLIDFNKMKANEFCNGPGKSKLLNFKEKYELLNSICMIGAGP